MATTIKPTAPGTASAAAQSYTGPLIIIGSLYFIYGFFTWINGTLIPYLKIACELESDFQAYLVATAFFIAYTVMAIPSFYVLRATGYKKGMALGLIIMAVGAVLFIPAAQDRNFNLFLVGLFIIGSGMALLQTASNPYVAIIGPPESAASRISLMGIANKGAGILGGLIFGSLMLGDADQIVARIADSDPAARIVELNNLAGRIVTPYAIMAGLLVLLAVAILFSTLPDLKDEGTDAVGAPAKTGKTSVLQFPHLVLGVLAIFLYVGVEVIAGDTIISYGSSLGIELSVARYFTQATLACMIIGYLVGVAAIPKYLSQEKALAICATLGVVFSILALLTTGFVSVGCIALLGLANSLMWPAIFPLAIRGLGRFTKIGSALLIMAIAGGAILPLVYGGLSDLWQNTRLAYIVMVPCYAFILYYAVKGYKSGWKA
jgi:glucose/galactose transporter